MDIRKKGLSPSGVIVNKGVRDCLGFLIFSSDKIPGLFCQYFFNFSLSFIENVLWL